MGSQFPIVLELNQLKVMSAKEKNNSNRRVSVLKNIPEDMPPKGITTKTVAWLMLALWLIVLVMKDLSVFLLSIPEFDELQVHEGSITFTKGGKRNTYLALDIGDKVIDFTCWISSAGRSNCIKHDQRPLYRDKRGKIYSYRAMINGFFYENRLLQLEIDGETVISYSEQKAEYLRLKRGHLYIHTVMVIPILIWLLLLYLENNEEYLKEKS
jgi:hypothetical protein